MTNTVPNEVLRLLDHAAAMNDRWLFLAAFLLLLMLCGGVVRWLAGQLESVVADNRAAQEAHSAALGELSRTQNDTTLKLALCLDRNTAALNECSFELRRFQERN